MLVFERLVLLLGADFRRVGTSAHPATCAIGCFGSAGYFICGNANSTPALAVFGQRCITALWRV